MLTVSAPAGGGGRGAGLGREPGEGVEEDGGRGLEAEGARDRGAVGAAEPYTDHVRAIEADRPGVAVAVARPGLEGDAAGGAVRRRRGAGEDVGDVPGRRPGRGRAARPPAAGAGVSRSATAVPPRAIAA